MQWLGGAEVSVIGLNDDVFINGFTQIIYSDFQKVQLVVEDETVDDSSRLLAAFYETHRVPHLERF